VNGNLLNKNSGKKRELFVKSAMNYANTTTKCVFNLLWVSLDFE
jgi:hypothetical protein